MVRFVVALLLALTVSTSTEARNRQVGNIVFEPPKDWRVGSVRNEGWVTLFNKRDDERCRFCYIRIHIGKAAKGSFKGWMRRRMMVAMDDGRLIENLPTKTFKQRGLGEVHMRSRFVKRNGKRMQVFLGFQTDNRFEMIHFEGDVSDKVDSQETQTAIKEEFLPMLSQLKLVSEGAKPVIGKPVPGDLDGVWFGSGTSYGMNMDGSMRMDVRAEIYTFYPDGRFYNGIPDSGISKFDYASAALTQTSETGNYIIKDREVRLFYADGERDTLERDGDAMQDGNARLWQVRIPEDGYRFDGRLFNLSYHPFAPGISGGVATSSDFRFYRNGRFTSDKFVGASGTFDTGGGFATISDDPKRSGRYEVSDGLIRLTPPEGQGEDRVWTFFLQESKGKWRPIVRGKYLKDE